MVSVERWTTADLERFPDDDALRFEIIDGELHVTKAPDTYHQIVAGRIAAALDAWSTTVGNGYAIAAPGIILDDDDNLIPDVVWISPERLTSAMRPDGKLHELPELIVEVLSPGSANVQRDREDKPVVYGRQGAREYWLVDWPQRILEIYRNDGAGTLQHSTTLTESDLLRSPLLPGFEQPIARFFVGICTQEMTGKTATQKDRDEGSGTEKISFYLRPDQLDKLDELALAYKKQVGTRINRNEIVRRLIDRCDLRLLLDEER
jgi:Uma2 family endonuclease